MKPWDVVIVGGGILGTSVAYWLASQYEGRIAVIEQEAEVGQHASGRNTGVIHRPFHLHPERSRRFARCSLVSYDLWKMYAQERGLPWVEVGTLKLAVEEEQVPYLETNMGWAAANGMEEDEVELLDAAAIRMVEPNVRCEAALHAKREVAVDFGVFTRELRRDAEAAGVKFLLQRRVQGVAPQGDDVEIDVVGVHEPHRARYLINCAGGEAVDIAHALGVGKEYGDLHFRGEYWQIRAAHYGLSGRNLYTVPRHPDFPFLDPHWVVRVSGRREIGPNAVPVAGPWTYSGHALGLLSLLRKAWEPPLINKARLVTRPTFWTLVGEEALGSLSRSALAGRVRRFLPAFRDSMVLREGTAGVRSSVVDERGTFVREALEFEGHSSFHVLNYNSPGATGSPAFSASMVAHLESRGRLDHLRHPSKPREDRWSLDQVVDALD